MKLLTFVLLLSFILSASNMTLGPYNQEKFVPAHERQAQEKIKAAAKKEKQKTQIRAFEKRQAELKVQKQEARRIRIEKEEQRQEKIQQEEERVRQEEERVKQEREAQVRAREDKARYEQRVREDYLAKQKQEQAEEDALYRAIETGDTNLSLIPEQADITVNNPDDIETELANITRLRYILLYSDSTPQFIKDYILMLDELNEKYNIDLAFAYRAIAQGDLDSGESSGGGKYDVTLRWRATKSTHFALKLDGRHTVGEYSSVEFRNEIGSLASTSASYRNESFYASQLWGQQILGNFLFRAGKIDPSSFIDSHLFKSNSRFFFNSTFSSSPYNSFPSNGIGVTGKYTQQSYYVTAQINDANAVYDEMETYFFFDHEYYSAIEFGITPKDGSKYHLTAWHRDANKLGLEEAKGVIASFVHALDTDTHLIIRGAASDYAVAKRYASIGIGKFSLFAEHDISGLAIGVLEPYEDDDDEINKRTEMTIESFYRVDPLPGVQLSADLQLIHHPSLGDQTWAILPGVRLRILF